MMNSLPMQYYNEVKPFRRAPWAIFAIALAMLLAILPPSLSNNAFAVASGSPAIDGSCAAMSTYGFTAGIVYCVQKSIDNAVTTYVTAMQKSLRFYEGMMATVAIIFFGFKLMNSSAQEPVKELFTLLLRILIGVFAYENAVNIYHWIAGTLPNSDGIINEAIGWVTGTGSGAGSGNMFSQLINAQCNAKTLPQTFEGSQVWQAFDCMFQKILGAASPTDHPFAFSTSLLVIVGASLLSGTLGAIVAGLGVTLFINALMLVFRALYLVLMSYMCVGFMALFAPLIGPMLFFESKYLTEKFTRWVSIIISCIFQPVIVIGFLAMAIAIDDQIIEGNFAAPGCTLPTYPTSGSTASGEPAAGWGQDGSGVCSFTQLFNQGKSGGVDIQTAFHNLLENNNMLIHASTFADPKSQCTDNNGTCAPTQTDLEKNGVNHTVPGTEAQQMGAAGMDWTGATRLKNYAPVKQLMLTLLTFIFITYCMVKLLDIIPAIAQSFTIFVGVSLMQGLKLPFEDELKGAAQEAQDKASKYGRDKGLIPKLFNPDKSAAATARMQGARKPPGS